ncbi:hypothetical protein HMPREF3039_03146 [Akkermansia sp. KLE1798]|nr:hypothetical protein HMPREF3039_03146 [Akkermansia sp. KLE1798]
MRPSEYLFSGEIAAIRKACETHCRWMKSADDFLFEIETGNLSMELDNCFMCS